MRRIIYNILDYLPVESFNTVHLIKQLLTQ